MEHNYRSIKNNNLSPDIAKVIITLKFKNTMEHGELLNELKNKTSYINKYYLFAWLHMPYTGFKWPKADKENTSSQGVKNKRNTRCNIGNYFIEMVTWIRMMKYFLFQQQGECKSSCQVSARLYQQVEVTWLQKD